MKLDISAWRAVRGAGGHRGRSLKRIVSRVVASCAAATVSLSVVPGVAPAEAAPGATTLEQKVDALVKTFRDETNVPGITVAVGKQGRLLLSKGYGAAMKDGAKTLPMKSDTRTSMGSISKAAITGPAAYQLLKQKGIDPTTQTLYGPNGLFEGRFDDDIDVGIVNSGTGGYRRRPEWKGWYESITIQQLFDHYAGLQKDASKANAAQMFGVSEEELTRDQYHRYFLRKGRLLHQPGTKYSYSNHGFGLFALIIEELSGVDFYQYVRDQYLKPMKLHNAIQGSTKHPDSCDSHNHMFTGADPATSPLEVLAYNESFLGLAQGGFRSSSQDLVRLMRNLEQKYSWDEIDGMGWGANSSGRLAHSGKVAGGTAIAMMYPDGYTTSTKKLDLSGVQVAISTNVWLLNGDLDKLGRLIASEVPLSDVDPKHDLWPKALSSRSCEYSRHDVPSREYQSVFDKAVAQGHELKWVNGFTVDGELRFNAVFQAPGSPSWKAHHNLTASTYQQKFDDYKKQGFSVAHVDSYAVVDDVYYAAIWKKGGGQFRAYHGKTPSQHQQRIDDLTDDGWQPRVISVASVNGKRYYTALYLKKSIGSYEARSSLTAAQYQAEADSNDAAGRHLRYVDTYMHQGEVRFSAIFASKPKIDNGRAKHGLTNASYTSHWKKNTSAGCQTQALAGYEKAGEARFAAVWAK